MAEEAELLEKLTRQKQIIQEHESRIFSDTMAISDSHIQRILVSTYCKKCVKCMAKGLPLDHHKQENRPQSGKKDECQYVLFRNWIEWVVENKDVLSKSASYMETLEKILIALTASSADWLPDVSGHFWRLFNKHLPHAICAPIRKTVDKKTDAPKKNTSKTVEPKKTICKKSEPSFGLRRLQEIQRQQALLKTPSHLAEKDAEFESVPLETPVSSRKQEFLDFFKSFFETEYGTDCMDGVSELNMDSRLGMDLYMDMLGYVNLASALCDSFPENVIDCFGKLEVPMTFFRGDVTVYDVYQLIK